MSHPPPSVADGPTYAALVRLLRAFMDEHARESGWNRDARGRCCCVLCVEGRRVVGDG